MIEALEDLFPDYLELQLGKPQAATAMDAEAERQMGTRSCAVDDELIRPLDRLLVTVARNVPHHDLVVFLDRLAPEFKVLVRGASLLCLRRLSVVFFGHEALEQRRIVL